MSGRHAPAADRGTLAERLYVPGRSLGRALPYRLPATAKLIGLVLFVVSVALTPRRAVVAIAVDAVVFGAMVASARLPIRVVARRLLIVLPFVVMAILIAFIGHGPRVRVLGISLSIEGLWAAWNIIAKSLLGAGASIVFAATTPLTQVLRALTVLRVPSMLVAIVAFMFRYLDVLIDEFARTRRAMMSRGHDPRWLWQASPMASAAGAMFVRSYERGERVHLAMAARGFTGAMPDLAPPQRSRRGWRTWLPAIAPGLIALAALLVAVGLRVGR